MVFKGNMAAWKKVLILMLISSTLFIFMLYKEIKNNKTINNYNFQGDWICYNKKENFKEIMHLSIQPSFIKENEIIKEYYEIFDKLNEDKKSTYEIFTENKKYANIVEINKNKIEYIKEKLNYTCKRSSKTDHSEDFTGKWIGYINKTKSEKLTKEELSENKIILDIYKDRLFIDAENIPVKYYEQKINNFIQENGNFKIILINSKKEKNIFEFKILSNKEIILIPNEFNQKETYLKRYNKF